LLLANRRTTILANRALLAPPLDLRQVRRRLINVKDGNLVPHRRAELRLRDAGDSSMPLVPRMKGPGKDRSPRLPLCDVGATPNRRLFVQQQPRPLWLLFEGQAVTLTVGQRSRN
jgi:hypothetical protein